MVEIPRMPKGFDWGVATASQQIEGSPAVDGRGASIWDEFERQPGAIKDGSTSEIGNDHYLSWRKDVDSLARMNVGAYRFSIAWPRIQPEGRGAVEKRGLSFYSQLIDTLLERGIKPWVTLYHWDLPQALHLRGGWPARDTAERFADYAMVVFDAFRDRVSHWTTLNEPYCSAFHGYASGHHAPGERDPGSALAAAHHLLLGHGMAVQRMREVDASRQFGVTINLTPIEPASPSEEDVDAARRVDGIANRWFLDPILRSEFPKDIVEDLKEVLPDDLVRSGDLEVMGQPLDFLGVNYYMRHRVSAGGGTKVRPGTTYIGAADAEFHARGLPRTDMGWEIDPDGMRALLERLNAEYDPPPIWITENGAAFDDEVDSSGRILDLDRIDYLRTHLLAVHEAIEQGVDVRGYFAWTLNDNFEWAFGISKRFGLIHYDHDCGRRTDKSSALWFSKVAASNALIPTHEWDSQRSPR